MTVCVFYLNTQSSSILTIKSIDKSIFIEYFKSIFIEYFNNIKILCSFQYWSILFKISPIKRNRGTLDVRTVEHGDTTDESPVLTMAFRRDIPSYTLASL